MSDDPKTSEETALEDREIAGERLFSPSAARNREPIASALLARLPAKGRVLEIGSGTGEHGVHLARLAPELNWCAGDPDPKARASIAAWRAHAGLSNFEGPHQLDMCEPWWEGVGDPFDALVSINMVHIAPFEAVRGLFAGAQRVLRSGGLLFLYGPFARAGAHTAPSNAAFDAALKARDPRWGLRDLEQEIAVLAQENALRLTELVEMPANNLLVAFALEK